MTELNNFESRFASRVAAMFATLGSERFEEELLGSARDCTGCEHIAFFTIDANGALLDYHSLSIAEEANSGRAGANFLARIWPRDPALFKQNVKLVCQEGSISVCRRLSRDVDDSEYRRICYDEVGIADRVTLHCHSQDVDVALGLYRTRKSGPFPDAAISALKVVGSTFVMAAARHLEFTRRASSLALPDEDGHWGPYKLSRREFEIAERICLGMTTAGIAIELSISPNTVLTYRKRIYSKLHISSQRELLAQRYRIRRYPLGNRYD